MTEPSPEPDYLADYRRRVTDPLVRDADMPAVHAAFESGAVAAASADAVATRARWAADAEAAARYRRDDEVLGPLLARELERRGRGPLAAVGLRGLLVSLAAVRDGLVLRRLCDPGTTSAAPTGPAVRFADSGGLSAVLAEAVLIALTEPVGAVGVVSLPGDEAGLAEDILLAASWSVASGPRGDDLADAVVQAYRRHRLGTGERPDVDTSADLLSLIGVARGAHRFEALLAPRPADRSNDRGVLRLTLERAQSPGRRAGRRGCRDRRRRPRADAVATRGARGGGRAAAPTRPGLDRRRAALPRGRRPVPSGDPRG